MRNDDIIDITPSVMVDVGEALRDQFDAVIRTRNSIIDDYDSSGSEKAAILNATTTILKDMEKLQKDLYNSGTIARLQGAILEALEEETPEFKARVVKILEEKLERFE